ncbi:MAG: hypothetical protein WKF57_06510 [Nakamurella sp.]
MKTAPLKQAPPRAISIASAHTALERARRSRAEWLVSLSDGMIRPLDVFAQAATLEGAPLRKLTLRQVLTNTPGIGEATVRKQLTRLSRELGIAADHGAKSATVGWLLDNRTHGRRFIAWLGTVECDRVRPAWSGWPFAVEPGGSSS